VLDKTKLDFMWDKIHLIPKILDSFFLNMMFSGNWSIVWFVALLSLMQLRRRRKNTEGKLVLLSILLFFGLYFSTALFTVNYEWIAGTQKLAVLSRLILHFYPLSVLLIILFNHPDSSAEGKNISF